MKIKLAAKPTSRRAKPRPANGTLMARPLDRRHQSKGPSAGIVSLAWAFGLERVTRIELALSAWEIERAGTPDLADQEERALGRVSVDQPCSLRTVVVLHRSGTWRARPLKR
jgi:hypothetical protein